MMDAQILAEMNNMRIRIDERDGKITNQAMVITKLEQSRKDMKADRESLLRVAWAARLYLEHGEPELADDLEEALKEVEHLLD